MKPSGHGLGQEAMGMVGGSDDGSLVGGQVTVSSTHCTLVDQSQNCFLSSKMVSPLHSNSPIFLALKHWTYSTHAVPGLALKVKPFPAEAHGSQCSCWSFVVVDCDEGCDWAWGG